MFNSPAPPPYTFWPYCDASTNYTQIGGDYHERHHPHCDNEGRMDYLAYETHFKDIMKNTYRMVSDSIPQNIANEIFYNIAGSRDKTQLYGMDIVMRIFLKRVNTKTFRWRIDIWVKNVETCGCCKGQLRCGGPNQKKPDPTEPTRHKTLEYREGFN